MKKCVIISSISLAALCFFSCSKSPGDILLKIQNLYKSSSHEDVKKYYTRGSIKAMNELEKLIPKSRKKEPNVDKKFAEGAKWEVIDEKVNGDTSEIKIKYIDHPVENMKGLEITFKMKKEDRAWKIDVEKDLLMSIDMIKGMNKKMKFLQK